MPSSTISGIPPEIDCQPQPTRAHAWDLRCLQPASLLRLGSLALVDHSQFELEKVGLGTARRLCALSISLVESLAALVQGVNDVLALVLLECIPFEAICYDLAYMLDVGLASCVLVYVP